MGGGGDVVGALATAELARIYDGVDPILGGLTWERLPIDPVPGPRSTEEIADATELAPGILLAGADTHIRETGVPFAESRMAQFLGRNTVLVDIHRGPNSVADGLGTAARQLGCDLIVMVDVGGDVLAHGDEPGLRSPLCDAVMLAAAARLACRGHEVLVGIFGIGCDGELTYREVLARLAEAASAGGLCGARGLTGPVAERLEAAAQVVRTEASALPARAFRGACGTRTIRGEFIFELTTAATITFYLDPRAAIGSVSRLARAVENAGSLEEANDALNRLGVGTELDRELAQGLARDG